MITQVHPKPGVRFENCGRQLVWVGLRVLTIYCMLTHTQCRRTGCKRFVAQITDPLLPKYLEKYEDIYLEYVFARSVLFTSSDSGTRYQPNAEDVLREDTPTPTAARVFTGVRRTARDSDTMQLSTLRGQMMSLRHQLTSWISRMTRPSAPDARSKASSTLITSTPPLFGSIAHCLMNYFRRDRMVSGATIAV